MLRDYLQQIEWVSNQLRRIAQIPGVFSTPAPTTLILDIRGILSIELHLEDYPVQLRILSVARRDAVVVDNLNQGWLNPIAMGQIIATLDSVIGQAQLPQCWNCVHPKIKEVSKKLYLDGHYSNAAVDAFIEINDRVKGLYGIRHPEENAPDGVDLMHKAFSNEIKLEDLDTETGKNIQQGFHFMFSGAISAFRNPKAHSNKETITADEALRRIMFASSLMYKLDEAEEKAFKGMS